MEMNVNTGKGYVPADLNKPEEPPLGLIAMNSIQSCKKSFLFSKYQEKVILIMINLQWK